MANNKFIPKYVLIKNTLDGFVCVDSDNDTKRLLHGACVHSISNTSFNRPEYLDNIVIYNGMLTSKGGLVRYKLYESENLIDIMLGGLTVCVLITPDFYEMMDTAGEILVTAFCRVIFDS